MFDKGLLRSLRKEKGLSQADVAAAVGLTPSAIGNYERGVHEPSRPTAKKLAAYFGVDATAFWTDLARPAPSEAASRPATQGDVLRAIRALADAGARFSVRKDDGPLTITATFAPATEQLEKAATQLAMLLQMRNTNAAFGEEALLAMQSSIDAWKEDARPVFSVLFWLWCRGCPGSGLSSKRQREAVPLSDAANWVNHASKIHRSKRKAPETHCFKCFLLELLGRFGLPTSSLPRMRSTD